MLVVNLDVILISVRLREEGRERERKRERVKGERGDVCV